MQNTTPKVKNIEYFPKDRAKVKVFLEDDTHFFLWAEKRSHINEELLRRYNVKKEFIED